MVRLFFVLGSFFAFLGVALGAFAAHLLKAKLPPDLFAVFEVGVRYQIYHAFALFVTAWAASHWKSASFALPGLAFALGIVIFSGSLYALSLSGLRWFGAITPLGGLLFLLGWLFLALQVWRAPA